MLNCCLQMKACGIGPRVEVAGEKLRCWGYYCEQSQKFPCMHMCVHAESFLSSDSLHPYGL